MRVLSHVNKKCYLPADSFMGKGREFDLVGLEDKPVISPPKFHLGIIPISIRWSPKNVMYS